MTIISCQEHLFMTWITLLGSRNATLGSHIILHNDENKSGCIDNADSDSLTVTVSCDCNCYSRLRSSNTTDFIENLKMRFYQVKKCEAKSKESKQMNPGMMGEWNQKRRTKERACFVALWHIMMTAATRRTHTHNTKATAENDRQQASKKKHHHKKMLRLS